MKVQNKSGYTLSTPVGRWVSGEVKIIDQNIFDRLNQSFPDVFVAVEDNESPIEEPELTDNKDD